MWNIDSQIEAGGAMVKSGKLLADLPDACRTEQTELLCHCNGVRFERIVSCGQMTPAGQWYDQSWDEWVTVVQGEAHLLLEEELEPRRLVEGDWILLPAHCRHRVQWTPPDRATVWLALHIPVIAGEEV